MKKKSLKRKFQFKTSALNISAIGINIWLQLLLVHLTAQGTQNIHNNNKKKCLN